jgi:hypothetical protein
MLKTEISKNEKEAALNDLLSRYPNLHPSKHYKYDYSEIEELFVMEANPGSLSNDLRELLHSFSFLLLDKLGDEPEICIKETQEGIYTLNKIAGILLRIEMSKIALS